MLFNSVSFGIFLTIVFFLYYLLQRKSLRVQNALLLIASYSFYGCWDYRFLFLLIFSTFLDYYTGLMIYQAKEKTRKKIWLVISISINLGFLFFFKYYNFFAKSFASMTNVFGLGANPTTLKILLPVGISFYTFHGLSYVIDIYKKKIVPTIDFINYSLFVSFFPLLVAGPIERASHLLPQLERKRKFDYNLAVEGLRQMIWGFFKKIVVADNCARFANMIFNDYQHQGGSTLVLGAILFAVQIYCDFSGYSDIALGTARLFNIELLKNFSFPYFSRDIAEFWRRWHISLSSWFRDYVYIPLGGSLGGTWTKIRNTFIIFLLSGFWHGANWTFIFWGGLNAVYFLPLLLTKQNRRNMEIVAESSCLPSVKELAQMLLTFSLVTFAWIFFRSPTLTDAVFYVKGIFSASLFTMPLKLPVSVYFFIVFLFFVEWIGRREKYAIANLSLVPRLGRWAIYYFLVTVIIQYKSPVQEAFIYFQF